MKGTLAVHLHTDKDFGEHKDYRLVGEGRSHFFSTRSGFPKVGKTYMWFEKDDHSPDHNKKFYGEIPAGYAGEGKVEHLGNYPLEFEGPESENAIDFKVGEGDHPGKYSLRRIADKNWLIKKHKEEVEQPEKAAMIDPVMAALLYPTAQRMGMVPPINDTVYDVFAGYPLAEEQKETVVDKLKSIMATAGKGAVLGAGFAGGSAVANKAMDWWSARNAIKESQDLNLKDQNASTPEDPTESGSDITRPAFSMGSKPAGFSIKHWGHHNDD